MTCDLCVIGAGSGGLSVAAGASQMGANVVLIEKGDMGGDCLNTGCVPSKALLAAAHAAQGASRTGRFGIEAGPVKVDGQAVFAHIRDVIAAIAPHDSQERFEDMGVRVVRAAARFVARSTVEAADTTVHAKFFAVATGSRPFVPPIGGLDVLDALTNETVFGLKTIPEHLIVIGGGSIGIEMAQAFRHLGAAVTVLEMGEIMPKDDPELVEIVRTRLQKDGVVIHEGAQVVRAQGSKSAPEVVVKRADGGELTLRGSHVLVAAGRRVNVEGLGLERAGVDFSPRGIEVDARLRSVSNRRVFALGDVAAVGGVGGYQFTHVASYHAGIVIRNVLFKWPAKVKLDGVPWVTYTDPELAQAGLSEARARERLGESVKVLRWNFADNDRACTEDDTDGLIKAVVTKRGRILGCSIVGPRAGELIAPWVLAMEQGLKIGALASTIQPYPTLGEVSKRAAGRFYTTKLYSAKTKAIVRFLLKWFS